MSSVSELLGPILYTRTIPWVRTALNRTQVNGTTSTTSTTSSDVSYGSHLSSGALKQR